MSSIPEIDRLRECLEPSKQSALDQCLVDRAAELACEGQWAAAEELLQPLLRSAGVPASALDLMARIAARSGRFSEAEEYWAQVLKVDPGNHEAGECIQRLRRAQRLAVWLVSPGFRWSAVLGALLLFGSIFLLASRSRAPLPTALPPQITPLLAQQTRSLGEIQERLKELVAERAAMDGAMKTLTERLAEVASHGSKQQTVLGAVEQRGAELSAKVAASGKSLDELRGDFTAVKSLLARGSLPPSLDLNVQGIGKAETEGALHLSLDQDAFDARGSLVPSARASLSALAKKVGASGQALKIEVVAFPYPADVDEPLARARAMRAANFLAETRQVSPGDLFARVGTDRELKPLLPASGAWRDPSRVLLLRISAAAAR